MLSLCSCTVVSVCNPEQTRFHKATRVKAIASHLDNRVTTYQHIKGFLEFFFFIIIINYCVFFCSIFGERQVHSLRPTVVGRHADARVSCWVMGPKGGRSDLTIINDAIKVTTLICSQYTRHKAGGWTRHGENGKERALADVARR